MATAAKEGFYDRDLRMLLKAALYRDIGRNQGKGHEHGRF